MPCASQNICEMLPEIHTMENCCFRNIENEHSINYSINTMENCCFRNIENEHSINYSINKFQIM